MKFLCDRCKTRYSIGDERVRGKILKIRCKNCNNVITVREGMPEIGADEGRRRGEPTQAIDPVPPGNALGAAFASAMTKPPPALEEEWYVSIEGDQAGPFSLAEAQRWVAGKSTDADLHCWSEGFDDWLPVDKVSHFRGLRKKSPSLPAPPPIPRAATTSSLRPLARPAPVEEEPKPLFAATMASLEKATQPPLGSGNFGLPPLATSPTPSSRGTPLGGQAAMPALGARTNGSAAVKTPLPSGGSGRVAAAAKPAYSDPADSATQIESPAFEDESRTASEPAAPTNDAFTRALRDKKPDPFANKADPFAQTTPQQAKPDPFANKPDPFARPGAPVALDLTQQVGDHDIDGDLDIGEVSRVVKLADIVKPPSKADRAPAVARTATPVGRTSATNLAALSRTGNIAALNRTGSAASIPIPTVGPDGKQIDPTTGEPIPLAPQIAVSHRRGMIALLVGALVLLGGAAAAVIYIVTSSDEGSGGGLVGYDVDTTRPDDPRRKNGTAGVVPVDDKQPTNPFVPKPRVRPTQPTNPNPPTNPNAKDLRPDEVEEMAGKYSGSTQTCWRRSQRGSEAILLSDLKKLGVTLVVDKSGVVTSVSLSEHATTSLGKCLMSSIKSWRFRESTAGITARITLVFQGV